MTHRARKYFDRKKEFKSWARDWIHMLEFPPVPEHLFADILVKKEVRIPLGPVPAAFIAEYRHLSHVDEMAMIPLQLPAPVIRHMEFLVETNKLWEESVKGMGIPPNLLQLPPIHIKNWREGIRADVLSIGGNPEPFFTPLQRIQFFLEIDASDIHDEAIMALLDKQCDLAMWYQLEEQLKKDLDHGEEE